MIKSLAHACIYSTDLARAESLYCGILGLRVLFRFIKHEQPVGFHLRISDAQFIEVFLLSQLRVPVMGFHFGHLDRSARLSVDVAS